MSRVDLLTDLPPLKDVYFATTRQFTGTPFVHRGYVYDRTTGKVVSACPHKHRYQDRAGMCAEAMLRRLLKEAGE